MKAVRLLILGLIAALTLTLFGSAPLMAAPRPLPLTIYNGMNYARPKPTHILHLGSRKVTGITWSSYTQTRGTGHGTIHTSGHEYAATVKVSQVVSKFGYRSFEDLKTTYRAASGITKVQWWAVNDQGQYKQVEQNPAVISRTGPVMADCHAKDVKAEKTKGIVNHEVEVVIKGSAHVWCTTPPNEFRLRMKIMAKTGDEKFHEVAQTRVFRTAPNKFGKDFDIEHLCRPEFVYEARLVVWGVSDQGVINPPVNVDSKHLRVVKCVAGHGGGRH